MADDSEIALCRSEWLQDATIELGRRFAVRHPFRTFTVQVDTCDHGGEQLERLAVWASTMFGTLVNLTLSGKTAPSGLPSFSGRRKTIRSIKSDSIRRPMG
jgi:hypothetical protein